MLAYGVLHEYEHDSGYVSFPMCVAEFLVASF